MDNEMEVKNVEETCETVVDENEQSVITNDVHWWQKVKKPTTKQVLTAAGTIVKGVTTFLSLVLLIDTACDRFGGTKGAVVEAQKIDTDLVDATASCEPEDEIEPIVK